MISEKILLDESEELRCRAGRAARATRFFRGRKNSVAKSVFLLLLFFDKTKKSKFQDKKRFIQHALK
jgi:hypothetical protein